MEDNRKHIEVCFSPYLFPLHKEEYEIIVVIDVLRATSAICAAFDNGVSAIIPVSTIEEAIEYRKKGYLVGAERKGQIVDGFDFGNSPFSYMKEEVKEKEIEILNILRIENPEMKNIISLFNNFENENHICLVFELLVYHKSQYHSTITTHHAISHHTITSHTTPR